MADTIPSSSARRDELLDRAYDYVLAHGLAGMSLRPLATAIGSSPRVLLFLFGSKEALVRALLARARREELDFLARVGTMRDVTELALATWDWLSDEQHRGLLVLWTESYAQALIDPDGPWAGFARGTVEDWLALLAQGQPPARRRSKAGETERRLVLALLRGALLDLLATGERERTTRAVRLGLEGLASMRR